MKLPKYETLLLAPQGLALLVTLNRPKVRNAMNLVLVEELSDLFRRLTDAPNIRAVVLRGSDGHFCAGGDIKDMATARQQVEHGADSDPFFTLNRAFGRLISQVNQAPQMVICLLEGAVLGGGFGLACVSDLAIAVDGVQFGLPETSLGLPPAQIAPFVVARIGLTQARPLALLGQRFDGKQALRLGLIHQLVADEGALQVALDKALKQLQRCAPGANAVTKALMLAVDNRGLESLLDRAAADFSSAVQGPEGSEGTRAFVEKRPPFWALGEELGDTQ